MRCGNCRTAIATARYSAGTGTVRQIAPLCDPCVERLNGMGFGWVKREQLADTRPVWMRNLRAKDYTGTVA